MSAKAAPTPVIAYLELLIEPDPEAPRGQEVAPLFNTPKEQLASVAVGVG